MDLALFGQPLLEHPQQAGMGAAGKPVVTLHVERLGIAPLAAAVPPTTLHTVRPQQQLQRPLVMRPVLAFLQTQRHLQQPGGQRHAGTCGGLARAVCQIAVPMLHPLRPVVRAEHGQTHGLRAQAGLDAFKRRVDALPLALGIGQQRVVGSSPGLHRVGRQFQFTHRRGQHDVGQMLGQQTHAMLHALRGLGGMHCERSPIACRPGAHGIVVPVQGEGPHAAVARGQPTRHLHQQAPGAKQQGRRMLHPRHQFQPGLKGRWQGDPVVRLGPQAVGLVQRSQQGSTKPAHQPATRQAAHLPQRAAAHACQCGLVLAHSGHGLQWQGVEPRR